MFYCEECRKAREWPESILLSYGSCELCGRVRICHDRPSSSLPKKTPSFDKALGLTLARKIQKKLSEPDVFAEDIYERIQMLPEDYQEAIRFIVSKEFDEILNLAERNA